MEQGSPGAALTGSLDRTNSEGVKAADPKATQEVQAPGKGSRDAVLKALRDMQGGIVCDEVAIAHSSGCSTHSGRLSDQIDDRGLVPSGSDRVKQRAGCSKIGIQGVCDRYGQGPALQGK